MPDALQVDVKERFSPSWTRYSFTASAFTVFALED
jgi:hypothetical protein